MDGRTKEYITNEITTDIQTQRTTYMKKARADTRNT